MGANCAPADNLSQMCYITTKFHFFYSSRQHTTFFPASDTSSSKLQMTKTIRFMFIYLVLLCSIFEPASNDFLGFIDHRLGFYGLSFARNN